MLLASSEQLDNYRRISKYRKIA